MYHIQQETIDSVNLKIQNCLDTFLRCQNTRDSAFAALAEVNGVFGVG